MNPPLTTERWAPPWWSVFLIGLVLWAAAIGVAYLTHNVIVLPTIVLIGSFLVPVTAVVWYLDHDPSPELSPRRILTAFLIGGVVGVLGASLLEYWLIGIGLLGTFEVGLIEEFVKGVFSSISDIVGYIVVSIIGLVPLIWLWRRADGGGVLPRGRRPTPVASSVSS